MSYLTTIVNGEIVRVPNTFQKKNKNDDAPSTELVSSIHSVKPLVNADQRINATTNLSNNTNQIRSNSNNLIDVKGKIIRSKNILMFIHEQNNKSYKIDILTCINPKNNFENYSFILNISNTLVRFNKDSVLDIESYKSIISFGKLKSSECQTVIKNIW